MPIETATYVNDLNVANPPGTDDRRTADDHFRLVKTVLKNNFPNLTFPIVIGTDTTNDDDYVINPSPAVAAYVDKMMVFLRTSKSNTTSSGMTLNVSSLGTKAIKGPFGILYPGQLPKAQTHLLQYNGTDFIALNPVQMRDSNLICNGDFIFWVNGTSFTVTTGNINVASKTWKLTSQGSPGGQLTISKVGNATTSKIARVANFLRILVDTADTGVAADDLRVIETRIEGKIFNRVRPGSEMHDLIFSFKVRSSKTGIYSVYMIDSPPTYCYTTEFTVDAADTVEYKEIVIPGSSLPTFANDNTGVVRIGIGLQGGTNLHASSLNNWNATSGIRVSSNQVNFLDTVGNDFRITEAVLVETCNSGVYHQRSYPEELAYVSRYFQKLVFGTSEELDTIVQIDGYGDGTTLRGVIPFPFVMCARPTLSTIGSGWNKTNTTATAFSVSHMSTTAAHVTVALTAGGYGRFGATTGDGIELDAALG